LLANLAELVIVSLIAAAVSPSQGYEPAAILATLVSIWLAILIVFVWQIVGLWRSAERRANERRKIGRGAFWARAAQVMAVLAVVQNVAAFNNSGLPQINEMSRIALQNDPDIPDNQLQISDDGKIVVLNGGIKYGLAHDLEILLKAAPGVTGLELTSPGGRIAEAKKIFDLVRTRGLDTFVPVECSSACTLVFIAGRNRLVSPGGRLGFHGSYFPGMTKAELAEANADWGDLYREAGIDGGFISRALAVSPDDILYPTAAELSAAGVTQGTTALAPNVPSDFSPESTLASVKSALWSASPIYKALDDAAPEEAAKVYSLTQDYSSGAITEAEFTSRVQAIIIKAVQERLSLADDAVLVDFAQLVSEEYAFLLTEDAGLCFSYAVGTDVAIASYLSPELRTREQGIDTRVLTTARQRVGVAQETVDAIWDEVYAALSRKLLPEQIAVFGKSVSDVRPEEKRDYCLAAIQTFQDVAQLPTWKAAAVMRNIYK
jgi:hypothetical protein